MVGGLICLSDVVILGKRFSRGGGSPQPRFRPEGVKVAAAVQTGVYHDPGYPCVPSRAVLVILVGCTDEIRHELSRRGMTGLDRSRDKDEGR